MLLQCWKRVRGLCAFLGLLLLLIGCQQQNTQEHAILPSDVYIWQHKWTPGLLASIQNGKDSFQHWRVLVSEISPSGDWKEIQIHPISLKQTQVPAIAVFRIDGRIAELDTGLLIERLRARLASLRQDGAVFSGVEIDYDCGVKSLAGYATFLRALKTKLPKNTTLSITALPAWLDAKDLYPLTQIPDEMVLQVHAVQGPSRGLFNTEDAIAWAKKFDQITAGNFRLALPSYGSKIIWDEAGNLAGVESEATLLANGAYSQEWMAKPQALQQFLFDLSKRNWQHLKGVVWFRLPTDQDARAWRLSTLKAVVKGEPLTAMLGATLKPTKQNDLFDVVLSNQGGVDAELPESITLPASCSQADGLNGYQMINGVDNFIFNRHDMGVVAPGALKVIGWARCSMPSSSSLGFELHVSQ
ncbi:DUF3142 domain-containing protein [Leeia sp. TBRC 13508]|uniref:DUF3142 domain-containing protein n=1 Tax=Leeia speluncae TaxID=2884804 RepID=A0ABS8D4J0_9NEIS|nr:DUF3142 domain-containing protein [Leeia speluncae]MCB6183112.1 DUF3142 domain-containing protein [Leeia speluncae]